MEVFNIVHTKIISYVHLKILFKIGMIIKLLTEFRDSKSHLPSCKLFKLVSFECVIQSWIPRFIIIVITTWCRVNTANQLYIIGLLATHAFISLGRFAIWPPMITCQKWAVKINGYRLTFEENETGVSIPWRVHYTELKSFIYELVSIIKWYTTK